MLTDRTYLGDGASVELDPRGVVLTTSDGTRDTNTVVLEPSVLAAFRRWLRAHVDHQPGTPDADR